MKGKIISSLQLYTRCREISKVRLFEGFSSLFHEIADLVLMILPVNTCRPAFSQTKVTAFIFTVINVLIVKFTHKNLSVLDCYRFFLLAFKETFPNLELLCSLFTVTDYQFISLTRGICKPLNIFSLEYTYNI